MRHGEGSKGGGNFSETIPRGEHYFRNHLIVKNSEYFGKLYLAVNVRDLDMDNLALLLAFLLVHRLTADLVNIAIIIIIIITYLIDRFYHHIIFIIAHYHHPHHQKHVVDRLYPHYIINIIIITLPSCAARLATLSS